MKKSSCEDRRIWKEKTLSRILLLRNQRGSFDMGSISILRECSQTTQGLLRKIALGLQQSSPKSWRETFSIWQRSKEKTKTRLLSYLPSSKFWSLLRQKFRFRTSQDSSFQTRTQVWCKLSQGQNREKTLSQTRLLIRTWEAIWLTILFTRNGL